MTPSGLVLGIEQEHDLFDGERRLDFQRLFPAAARSSSSVPFRNSNEAAVLDAGYVLACDGWEAELATVPIPALGNGCVTLAQEVLRCRAHMLDQLRRAGVPDVHGYSTHINLSVPFGLEDETVHALARSVGPALILLMEAPASPGLLLRPRRGRVEIGSEYIDREQHLAAACTFLTGVVYAFLHQPAVWRRFPRLILRRWEPATLRPGVYLPHDAFGESVHARGRAAQLELTNGQTTTAGELLESTSELALEALEGRINPVAAEALRGLVRGDGELPIDRTSDPGHMDPPTSRLPAAPEAAVLGRLGTAKDDSSISLRFLDWEGAAFSWRRPLRRRLIIGVPWQHLEGFMGAIRDQDLSDFVAQLGAPVPELRSLDQLATPQVFRRVDLSALGQEAQIGKQGGRKHHSLPVPIPKSPRSWLIPLLITLITVVVLVGTGGTIRRIFFPGGPSPTPTLTATPSIPPTATPTMTLTMTPTFTATPTPTNTATPTPSPTRPRSTRTRTPRPPDQPPPQPTSCDPQDPACNPPPTACTPGLPNCP